MKAGAEGVIGVLDGRSRDLPSDAEKGRYAAELGPGPGMPMGLNDKPEGGLKLPLVGGAALKFPYPLV